MDKPKPQREADEWLADLNKRHGPMPDPPARSAVEERLGRIESKAATDRYETGTHYDVLDRSDFDWLLRKLREAVPVAKKLQTAEDTIDPHEQDGPHLAAPWLADEDEKP